MAEAHLWVAHSEAGLGTRLGPERAAPVSNVDPMVDRMFSNNLMRGLLVLQAFTPDEPMLGNQEIVRRTGLPKATVSRLTYTLLLLGYLRYSEKFRKYRLGLGVLSLGYPLLASIKIRQLSRPYLQKIAEETGCTVNLGILYKSNVVYIDSYRADRDNAYQPDIGSSRPLLKTSIGRALILGSKPSERAVILNRLKIDDPIEFAVDKVLLDTDERLFRKSGYCHSRGDWRKEIHAVSVPIRKCHPDEDNVAINCTMSAHRLHDDILTREAAPRLMEAALRIEQALGLN